MNRQSTKQRPINRAWLHKTNPILWGKKYFDYQPTAARMERAFLDHIRQKGLLRGQ